MMRRTPLRRGKPLKSGTSQLQRSELKRRRQSSQYGRAREIVLARDGGCVIGGADRYHDEGGRCAGILTFHHRRKRSAGGADTIANGATLCVFHNGWIEDEPELARRLFPRLVVREGDGEWDRLGRRAARDT